MFHSRFLCTALALAIGAFPALAAESRDPGPKYERVTLEPIRHQEASLTLTAADGTAVTFTPAELEALGSWRMITVTPWREAPAVFEGPLLADVLAAGHLDAVDTVEVTAENDYAVTIDRAVWESVPIMVATRVDGKAHSRRARGPIQFVMDMDDYTGSEIAAERHWVWMAATVEPAD